MRSQDPPPGEEAESAAEMQGETMEICKKSLDKRDLNNIIRQTDRISLSFSAARNLIMPELGALRPRFSRGCGAPFCVERPDGLLRKKKEDGK